MNVRRRRGVDAGDEDGVTEGRVGIVYQQGSRTTAIRIPSVGSTGVGGDLVASPAAR